MEFSRLAKLHLGKLNKKQFEGIQEHGWACVGSIPIFCNNCDVPFLLFANENSIDYFSGTLFGCTGCKSIKKGVDLSLGEKRFLSEYWIAAKGNFDSIGKANAQKFKDQDSEEIADNDIDFLEENEVTNHLRNGLRIVCWLKEEEAKAILEAYESEATVRNRDLYGREFTVMWFESGDSALEKFNTNANVLLVRHRNNGDRKIGWIYDFEAQFVIDSIKDNKSYDLEIFDEVKGAVVYFPNSSKECKKYRANVCLLRKRGYRYEY